MSQVLSEDEVRTALGALPGWSGDRQRLSRTVPATAQQQDEIERNVMQVANEINHHPQIERDAAGLRLILWSHDSGGVTARDVDLATRIDRALSLTGGD